MPKIKTHSGAKKALQADENGKVLRAHAYKSHILNKENHQAQEEPAQDYGGRCDQCGADQAPHPLQIIVQKRRT